jgi:hypothetical protein
MSSLKNKSFLANGILSFAINETRNLTWKERNFKMATILEYDVHFASIASTAAVETNIGNSLQISVQGKLMAGHIVGADGGMMAYLLIG